MNLRFAIASIVLAAFICRPTYAQRLNTDEFGIYTGFNHSELLLDTVALKPMTLPYLGAFYTYAFSNNIALDFRLGYGLRGSKHDSPEILRIHQFVDIAVGPRYAVYGFIFLEGGLQYSHLHFQKYYMLDGSKPSGRDRFPGVGYGSYLGAYIGAGIDMNSFMNISFRYNLHPPSAGHSNWQIGMAFKLSKEKWPVHRKKYKSFEAALENPLAVRRLVLHRQEHVMLPASIAQLENLEVLHLDGNLLTTLPPEIGELKKLQKLSVRHNKLKTLPPEIGLLESLEELHLDYNELRHLPDELFHLKELRFLHIGKNFLVEVPRGIGQLKKLVTLDVSNSGGLLVIPNEINGLRVLETLIIDRNTIFEPPFHFSYALPPDWHKQRNPIFEPPFYFSNALPSNWRNPGNPIIKPPLYFPNTLPPDWFNTISPALEPPLEILKPRLKIIVAD